MATANEGLAYLNSRKEFWQQEQPVYARRNKGQIISEQKCGALNYPKMQRNYC